MMLTAAKSQSILRILQAGAKLGKYLKENYYFEHYQQLSSNFFVKSFFISIITKSSMGPDDNFEMAS